MKKRIVLCALTALCCLAFLTSCTKASINIDRVKRFPVYGHYRIIGGNTVTCSRDLKFIDEDIISPALKKKNFKVDGDLASYGEYYGNYYFFVCKFYNRIIDEKAFPAPYSVKYAFGYVNFSDLQTTILNTVEKVESEYHSNYEIFRTAVAVNDNVIYLIDLDGYIGIIDAQTLEYTYSEFDGAYSEECNCVIKGIYGEWMLCDKIGDSGGREYYAVNYKENKLADGQTLENIVNEFLAEEEDGGQLTVPYKGLDYVCDISGEAVTFTAMTGESFKITMDDLIGKSEEARKVEEMGEVQIEFKDVVARNGEIYISAAHYNEGMFGMNFYSDATATICFLYEPETDEFKYIGWLRGNDGMSNIVKL